ncbi:MAG TPA: hypothetical protein VGI79_09105 [Caulobacteraceae bacterium]|jgi:hypothetical protein
MPAAGPPPKTVEAAGGITISLDSEVKGFADISVADRIALGDQDIRRQFALYIIGLFIGANIFVMIGLGVAYWQDCMQLAAKAIRPEERIIDGKVVMALLGATTVQLGTVIYTITNAIFPKPKG